MSSGMDLNRRCLCMVTGASRGIGRALAIEFAGSMGPKSVLVLMSRNEKQLEITKSMAQNSNVEILIVPVDLSNIESEQVEVLLRDCLSRFKIDDFDVNIIIHNAGSIGDLKDGADRSSDMTKWRKHFELNVFGTISLNCAFLRLIKGFENRTLIVNITSLCADVPFAGLTLYCSAKAAAKMYFRVLAEECPQIRVLNYSPGPVQTSMVDSIVNETTNEGLKRTFLTYQNENKMLNPETTAKKCLKVIQNGSYKSGDRVDYFD